VIPLIPEKEIK